jgi:hypothetical protein
MVRIVVWDPSGLYPEGALLEGPRLLHQLESRAVVSLPADPALVHSATQDVGYVRRGYGPGRGWNRLVGHQDCPMSLRVVPNHPWLHWAARVHPTAHEVKGHLRLCANTAQMGGTAQRLDPKVDARALESMGAPDVHGGWTVGGTSGIGAQAEGWLGLGLYGLGVGFAVQWFAVTQCSRAE